MAWVQEDKITHSSFRNTDEHKTQRQRERERALSHGDNLTTADGSIWLWALKLKRLFSSLKAHINWNVIDEFLIFSSDTVNSLITVKTPGLSLLPLNLLFLNCCYFYSHKTSGHYDPDKIPRGSQRRRSACKSFGRSVETLRLVVGRSATFHSTMLTKTSYDVFLLLQWWWWWWCLLLPQQRPALGMSGPHTSDSSYVIWAVWGHMLHDIMISGSTEQISPSILGEKGWLHL